MRKYRKIVFLAIVLLFEPLIKSYLPHRSLQVLGKKLCKTPYAIIHVITVTIILKQYSKITSAGYLLAYVISFTKVSPTIIDRIFSEIPLTKGNTKM